MRRCQADECQEPATWRTDIEGGREGQILACDHHRTEMDSEAALWGSTPYEWRPIDLSGHKEPR